MKKIDFTKKLPEKRLPRTLSGWIKASVEDALVLSKRSGFKLDMNVFNELKRDDNTGEPKICCVCLGGACIVGRGLVKPGDFSDIDDKAAEIAYALDSVRWGDLDEAADNLFRNKLINWVPTRSAMKRAHDLIRKHYRYKEARAPFNVYLEAAEILKHKPR